MSDAIKVLYEDNHLLVVNKPSDLATMGVGPDEPSLWRRACGYIKAKYSKPGNVYLGVVSRVDSLVTGVVVFARTSKAAARLSEQFRETEVAKIYWAICERPPDPPTGSCTDWLAKSEELRRMILVASSVAGAQEARLTYRTLRKVPAGAIPGAPHATLVEVRLETGRKHQIRVQMAARGWHVVGDAKYGARSRFARGIALHARRLGFQHPTRDERIEIEAPLPVYWPALDDDVRNQRSSHEV
jgi:23S rRNA pseudouridine1911/1915/1917 synthase